MSKYNFKAIEEKWQRHWRENKTFKVSDDAKKKKFYILDMFPYPSGEGLHVGHPKGYVATDIYARYKHFQGFNVLHPMGFDSFGLPAENYAIKNKINPSIGVKENIARFKKQLEQFGFNYDWDREIITSDPNYYKWTQWMFTKMFRAGLAYESHEPINWCPSCKTGLANEDIENGVCERCGTKVEKKPMRQWVLKMTDYAERLLDDLKSVDWEKSIIDQQINWIGKSKGSLIEFKIKNTPVRQAQGKKGKITDKNAKFDNDYLEVFTTRADTLYGATYMVVSPEHQIISNLKSQISNISDVEKYIQKAKNKSDLERTDLAKDKTGVELKGIKAINPANKQELPIYVADYVLSSYGTGAIMAVPAHDERDFEFANKYKINLIQVIKSSDDDKLPFIGNGKLINSDKFDGLDTKVAQKAITKAVGGKLTTKYKLRDWVFSRQRYWGEPIPIIHCDKCGAVAVPEKDLPVKLPEVKNYEPTGTGESPLAAIDEWVNTTCPECGGPAKRETNTMPQWAGSSWYYLRYIDPKNNQKFIDPIKEKYWMSPKGVDFYVGGAEHATRHLLYARFWHKFLFDIGAVSTVEPFSKLKHVGLIVGEDGRKMSKRWGNVVNPDDVISQYGADAFRMYEMFMGPFADSIAWSTDGVKGTKRFLDRIWQLYHLVIDNPNKLESIKSKTIDIAVKKIGDDIENFNLNTAISKLMIAFNERDFAPKINSYGVLEGTKIDKDALEKFLIILSPFAPHISSELWKKMGYKDDIYLAQWPKVTQYKEDEVKNIAIMVNGKTRGVIKIQSKNISDKQIIEMAKQEANVKKNISGKKIVKSIYVTGKVVSFVVK